MTKSVLIIDFGSQYTHLIGRKIRELGIYAEIYPPKYLNNVTNILNHSVLILSGGPDSVLNKNSPKIVIQLFPWARKPTGFDPQSLTIRSRPIMSNGQNRIQNGGLGQKIGPEA